jgi:hypothetical protein
MSKYRIKPLQASICLVQEYHKTVLKSMGAFTASVQAEEQQSITVDNISSELKKVSESGHVEISVPIAVLATLVKSHSDLKRGMADDDNSNKRPRGECYKFKRGECTFGANCRFVHT